MMTSIFPHVEGMIQLQQTCPRVPSMSMYARQSLWHMVSAWEGPSCRLAICLSWDDVGHLGLTLAETLARLGQGRDVLLVLLEAELGLR